MEEKLNQLKQLIYRVMDLGHATALLGWDQQVYMPVGGTEDRGDQLATLTGLSHEFFTSPEIGELLQDLKPYADQLAPDSDDACLIKNTQRDYHKATHVPGRWVEDFARTTTLAQTAWEKAKHNNDFATFLPWLEKIVDLRREYASFFTPYAHVYDPLLDDFEPGLKTADVQQIFGALRPQQVALISAIRASRQVDDSFLHVPYSEQGQWDFGVEVITRFGYDWNRGRQDRSVHPFTTSFGIDDVRITTRFDPDRAASALFSSMHEAGHAMYEQGISQTLRRTPLAGGASMAIHESQSRMWENLVGRSYAFLQYFYPRLQHYFPSQLGNVSLDAFYKGVNKVEPSLIRVEADEATYNLHIMLRMEIEIGLMEGSLAAQDLPEIWNSRMKEYLGIVPTTDREGVLQDVHWAGGSFGYFPTYALGNLVSAQLWEVIQRDIPNVEDQIAHGEFSPLLGWLHQNIHRHGAKFEPQELMLKITGSKIDAGAYVRYLQTKFGKIYGL